MIDKANGMESKVAPGGFSFKNIFSLTAIRNNPRFMGWLYGSRLAFPLRWLMALLMICETRSRLYSAEKEMERLQNQQAYLNRTLREQNPTSFSFAWEIRPAPFLQRAEQRIGRPLASLPTQEVNNWFYSYFSESYGDDYEEKRQRQYESYLPYLPKGLPYPFVDLGCGAGEFVDFLNKNGVKAMGVDGEMSEVNRARERGVAATQAEARAFLKESPEPLAGVSLLEVAEHLPTQELFELIQLAAGRLASGGVLLLESLNARHPFFAHGFYTDPTHIRPVTDEYLAFLLEWSGLEDLRLVFTIPAHVSGVAPNDLSRIYWCYAVIGKKP